MYDFTYVKLKQQAEFYVYRRICNTDFGDLVPHVIANLPNLELSVLDTNDTGIVSKHCFNVNSADALFLSIQRQRDHYNGIIMKPLESPHKICPTSTINADNSPPPAPSKVKI